MIKHDILNRWTRKVQFTAEIDCAEGTPQPIKVGMAITWAKENGAYLAGAYLAGANLAGAYLARANLAGAKNLPPLAHAQTSILPEGDIIGWKKCGNGALVKLLIPAVAKRSNATGRKCRAEYAQVLEVVGENIGVTNNYGPCTEYRAGETVRSDGFDENRWEECSNGIHFFITKEEAEAW